jgi:uncharacterized glyoxalase superfamily protein PhnB
MDERRGARRRRRFLPGRLHDRRALAYNARSPEEVDAVIAEAERAGATIPRHGAETFWGGYSGVFVDPDGHPWEVAHNPHWTIAEDGAVILS